MVGYEQLLSALSRQILDGRGRHMSPSLTFELLTACRNSLSSAANAISPPMKTATAAYEQPMEHDAQMQRGMAENVTVDTMRIMAAYSQKKAFFAKQAAARLVVTLFVCPPLFAGPVKGTLAKQITAATVTACPLKERSSALLVLSMQLLARFDGDAENHDSASSQPSSLSATNRWTPQTHSIDNTFVSVFLLAAHEVVLRLTSEQGKATSPALSPPKTGRAFQRRGATLTASTEAAQNAGSVGGAGDGETQFSQAAAVGIDPPLDAFSSVRRVHRNSSTDSVAEAEYVLLLDVLLRVWRSQRDLLGRDFTESEKQHLHELLKASAQRLSQRPFTACIESVKTQPMRLFSSLRVLLSMACVATDVAEFRDAGLAGFRFVHERQDDVLSCLSEESKVRLRWDAVRLLLERAKSGKNIVDDASPSSHADEVLSIFPIVIQTFFRGSGDSRATTRAPQQNPYEQTVMTLSPNYQAQLSFLVHRLYRLQADAARHHSPAALPVQQLRELDLLSDANHSQLKLQSCLGADRGDAASSPRGQSCANDATLQALRLIAHHYTDGVGTAECENARAFTTTLSRLLEGDDDVLSQVYEWHTLLEAVSVLITGSTSCSATEQFCATLHTQTRLLSSPLASPVADRTSGDAPGKHSPFGTLALLKRLWFERLQFITEGTSAVALREAMVGFLNACIRLGQHGNLPPSQGGRQPSFDVGVVPIAIKLLLIIESGTVNGAPTQERLSAASSVEEQQLSPEAMKEAFTNSLRAWEQCDSRRQATPYDVLNVLEITSNMMQFGLFDQKALELAASALNHVCSSEHIVLLSWKTRVTVLKRCVQIYRAVEPQFSSQSGCRQIGQRCLVISTRLCLEKYLPTSSSSEEHREVAAFCAVLVWSMCVVAVQKPLRKASLDKYLIVMTRFVRRYWACPPPDFLPLKGTDKDSFRRISMTAESHFKTECLHSSGGNEDAKTSAVSLEVHETMTKELIAFNKSLSQLASQLVGLTFLILREDKDVRARKSARYHELYFTLCFLVNKHHDAVIPSVWFATLQHATSFPKMFPSSERFSGTMQKTLELSAREVLRYADEHKDVVPWAERRVNSSSSRAGREVASAASFILTPSMVGRLCNVITYITNVEAKIILLDLAATVISLETSELRTIHARKQPFHGTETHDEDVNEETEALRRAAREEVGVLLNIIGGLRGAGKRTKRV